jgi:transposase
MIYKNVLEPLPKEKITFKKKPGGNVYVYYTVRAYRNKHGKPTSDEVAIGKKDNETGMLYPNERFYEIFPERKPSGLSISKTKTTQPNLDDVEIHNIKSCGLSATLLKTAQKTGLVEVIKKCFPDKWEQLLSIAFYMLDKSNAMMYIEDWFDETKIDFIESITGVKCSKIFASITPSERQMFFKEWMKVCGSQDYIVYDVTSISSYSKNIEQAEWGYNRDNEKLPQVNCGMFYSMPSRLPVYYDIYSGSIPDKVCLEYMLSNAKDIGIDSACLVMDRGFITKDNFLLIKDNQYSFVSAMPQSRIESRKLIDSVLGKIEKMENWISDHKVYGVSTPVSLHNTKLQAHIYFDTEKKSKDTNEYYAYIEKMGQELEKISKGKSVSKRYKEYFIINEHSQNAISYELNYKKINKKLERMGYFILLSSSPDLTSKEVLKIYRERDVIEKHFDQLKNGLEFKRIKTHCQKTTDGKLFVGFLALILRSYILKTIKNNPETKKLTFNKIMLELRNIKSVFFSNFNVKLKTLTSLQKTILAIFDVNIELLLN